MPKRVAHLLLIVLAAFTMLGAGSSSTPFERIGHKLMCPCGCAEILLECNHVGCPDSERMIGELRNQLSGSAGNGIAEAVVLNWFAAKYGPTVLAAPLRGGFDTVAWIVPFAVLGLGLAGVVLLLRLWQRRYAALSLAQPAAPLPTAQDAALRDRIRNDTQYGE